MEQKIMELCIEAENEVNNSAKSFKDLEEIRVRFLGKKGRLTLLLHRLGQLDCEERPRIGKLINDTCTKLRSAIANKTSEFKSKALQEKLLTERIDVTLPGRKVYNGHLHPLTLTLNHIKKIFLNMGYSIENGPEIETDYYNFEALNLPKNHPARDMQDSFYITEEILLRTQTSPVQVRTMKNHKPNSPIRMIAPGRVYRRDNYDASHSPMFTQIEGLVVDEGISFADLKGTLDFLCKEIFGNRIRIRLRPSFFPFTEPSTEVDVSCVMCNGNGKTCKVCKGSGWLEILGAGMVHSNVLRMSNYDPDKVSGFAFGLGIERVAMLIYGIDDMRLFFDNDVRFLNQF